LESIFLTETDLRDARRRDLITAPWRLKEGFPRVYKALKEKGSKHMNSPTVTGSVYINAMQTDLVHDLFVHTADENYITARWCAFSGLNIDFFWLAVHALEKYLKAVLLVNGHSSKNKGHKIVDLYNEVKNIGGKLLPDQLKKPDKLNIQFWNAQSAEDFIEHLYREGNPDNRYLLHGYVMHSHDLHMLDQMVFAVRRLICPLDERIFSSCEPGAPTLTYRENLIRHPDYYQPLNMPVETVIDAEGPSLARTAALNLNMAFAPTDFEHTPIQERISARNPAIVRRILDPLNDPRSAAEGLEVAIWFLANVQVSKESGIAEEIKAAMKTARDKFGI
jgi:hypothetical protein